MYLLLHLYQPGRYHLSVPMNHNYITIVLKKKAFPYERINTNEYSGFNNMSFTERVVGFSKLLCFEKI